MKWGDDVTTKGIKERKKNPTLPQILPPKRRSPYSMALPLPLKASLNIHILRLNLLE